MGSLDARRLQLILLGAIGVAALVGIIVVSTGGVSGGSISLIPGQESDEPDVVTGSRQSEIPAEHESEERPPDSVEAFTEDHGDPPNSDFARLRIPAIGVDAPVGLYIVDESIMPEPQGPTDVAFYDLSSWSGLGGYPGGGSNTVFGAHVDLNRDIAYAGDVHYRGPAVFWSLDALGAGDVIEVDYNGQTLRYAVAWVQHLDAGATDWQPIWSSSVAVDSITLFTCGGEFDFQSGEYSSRVVVRAERV